MWFTQVVYIEKNITIYDAEMWGVVEYYKRDLLFYSFFFLKPGYS
jgi:hypothetical protein